METPMSSGLEPLPRISDLREFKERYLGRDQAVVVTGGLGALPASQWSATHLAEVLAENRPTVKLGDGRWAHMRMRDFFAYFEASEVASSHGTAYLRDFYLKPSFGDAARARLAEDIRFPLLGDADWAEFQTRHLGWMTLWCGPAGSYTSLHVDPYATNTWLAAIAGRKSWRLCRPEAITDAIASELDPFAAGPLPCTFFEAQLDTGDVMYLPPRWWHAVRNETPTIAVSGNFCTIEHARACLAEVRAMPESSARAVWLKTWLAILDEKDERSALSA